MRNIYSQSGSLRRRPGLLAALVIASLIAGGALTVLATPQTAVAADTVDLGGGYSLDCSGTVPSLNFAGNVTSDNQGHTSGNTNIYFTTFSGRTGVTQEFGPTVAALPSFYTASYPLPGAATYSYRMKVGDGTGAGELRSVTIPDACPWYDYANPPLDATADNIAVSTVTPGSATVSFDYSLNTTVPAWAQPTGTRYLRVYIAPPGTRDWIVRQDIAVTGPGAFNQTYALAPGTYELSLGAWPLSGCGDCGGADPNIFSTTTFTVKAAGPSVPGAFVSVDPSRVLDTRVGNGAPQSAVAAYGTVDLQVTGRGGVPASGVAAVVVNVTVTAPSAGGFLTVYPSGTSQPTASNLNFTPGQSVPNLVTVKVGTGGKVKLTNSSGGTVHLIADVAGYYLAGAPTVPGAFVSLAPARVLDTRVGNGAPQTAVSPYGTVDLQVTGRGGIPATGVAAVVVNVTVTGPSAGGFLTVFPSGTTQPTASNLNFTLGQSIPNLVTVKVGTGGKIKLTNNSAGSVQLIADVAGYYLAGTPTEPGTFVSLAPARVLDTRVGNGAPQTAITSYGTVDLQVTGRGGVPAMGVAAVVMNVTVTGPSAGGFITVYPSGTSQPTASNLNFTPGQSIPNLVTVKVGTGGKTKLTNNSAGSTHLIGDVAGYYLAG